MSPAEPERVCVNGLAVRDFQRTPFLVMVQEFTLVAFQETVVAPPERTREGAALIVTVGGGETVTVTMFE